MYIYFNQWFGPAASDAGLSDAEAVDFNEPDGKPLTLGQLVKQPVDADFRADNILMVSNAMLVLQFIGGVAIRLAQPVHPAVTRDCCKPRQERPGRIVTSALAVERDQCVLHQIIDRIGRNLLREKPRQPAATCSSKTA